MNHRSQTATPLFVMSLVVLSMIGSDMICSQSFAQNRPGRNRAAMLKALKESDKNKDGKITKEELPERMRRMFPRMDANSDGVIDQDEVKRVEKRLAGTSEPGDAKPDKNQIVSSGAGVAVGETAPDFTLKSLDGKTEVKLSSFKGKRPVALIFGSYT